MTPAEKRLAILKEFLKTEQASKNPSQTYIDDLKLSIEQAKLDARNASEDGYRMVG